MSHVAVPFPPTDPIYGTHPGEIEPFPLGAVEPRGTAQVILRIPPGEALQQTGSGYIEGSEVGSVAHGDQQLSRLVVPVQCPQVE